MTDFATAAASLQVSLVGIAPDPDVISKSLAKGLIAKLVQAGEVDVTQDDLAQWGVPEGELWERALANVATDEAVVDSFVVEDALTFFHVHGEGAFIASLALRLPDLGESLPRHGWLFMVPHRRSLWFVPLGDLSHCIAGALIIERVADDLTDDQVPISGQIYWTNGNRITAVPLQDVETGEDLTNAIISTVRAGNAS
ncbi:MAG TPA: hypothetical protein VL326_01990 [Kofleriaceae bacterium]|nr:hypothetical protein [Kofleriaceae bacterium]